VLKNGPRITIITNFQGLFPTGAKNFARASPRVVKVRKNLEAGWMVPVTAAVRRAVEDLSKRQKAGKDQKRRGW
jgi:hypothetical protein